MLNYLSRPEFKEAEILTARESCPINVYFINIAANSDCKVDVNFNLKIDGDGDCDDKVEE